MKIKINWSSKTGETKFVAKKKNKIKGGFFSFNRVKLFKQTIHPNEQESVKRVLCK